MSEVAAHPLGAELIGLPATSKEAASPKPAVRIFVGTEDRQHRAERVFIYSIEQVRDPTRAYEIYLMKNLPGFDRSGWRTGFSNYRYAVPELAGSSGRAIYNDVDQIYLTDPSTLFDLPLNNHGYLSVGPEDTSVMLMDCRKMVAYWNLSEARSGSKLKLLRGASRTPDVWGLLDSRWNSRDTEHAAGDIRLLHYTALHLQPWTPFPETYSYHPHPLGSLWHDLERRADAQNARDTLIARQDSDATSWSIWTLKGHRLGDALQLQRIAESLQGTHRRIHLDFNFLHLLPGFVLGASVRSIRNSHQLQPPWPDLVLSSGKRSSSVARWIKQQSNGRTRIVNVGRPWCRLDAFDLIVTTPQYRLPALPNILHLTLPIRPTTLKKPIAGNHSAQLATLQRPRIAVLVGGNSASSRFTLEAAQSLARLANTMASQKQGSLMITGSPRTPDEAFDELIKRITAPAYVWRFDKADASNPYAEILELADEIIVTGESASMLADAVTTGQTIHVFALPRSTLARILTLLSEPVNWWAAKRRNYRGLIRQQGTIARFRDSLVRLGIFTPPRDLEYLHSVLNLRGLLSRAESSSERADLETSELTGVVERIRSLRPKHRETCSK